MQYLKPAEISSVHCGQLRIYLSGSVIHDMGIPRADQPDVAEHAFTLLGPSTFVP